MIIASICFHEYDFQLEFVDSLIHGLQKYGLSAIYLDCDDMGYSGNQTGHIMDESFTIIINWLKTQLVFSSEIDYLVKKSAMKFSYNKYLWLKFLDRIGINYKVIRLYATETAYTLWANTQFPAQIEVEHMFPHLEKLLGKELYDVVAHYISPIGDTGGNISTVSVYFDHKIADPNSTMIFPLLFGAVLPLHINVDVINYLDAFYSGRDRPIEYEQSEDVIKPCDKVQLLGPLMKNCGISLLKDINNFEKYIKKPCNRCPVAWYKFIDYEHAIIDLPRI
jgi:hypothetical protein